VFFLSCDADVRTEGKSRRIRQKKLAEAQKDQSEQDPTTVDLAPAVSTPDTLPSIADTKPVTAIVQ
jgi:hypothetical protein